MIAGRAASARSRRRTRGGFSLLEVMVAMAILAIALSAVFSAEAGSVRMATRARKMGFAAMLVRCKMGEIEEQVMIEGFPAIFDEGTDHCCKDAEIDGFSCKWEIEPVTMPDTMFDEDEEGKDGEKGKQGDDKDLAADGKTDLKDSKDDKEKFNPAEILKDPKKLLAGGSTDPDSEGGGAPDMDAIASMAMSYVYPILKPSFESQIRRATVVVTWTEGNTLQTFDVTQYLVAEQPIKLPDGSDPNAQDSTGTSPSNSSTGASTTTPLPTFGGSTNFGALKGGK